MKQSRIGYNVHGQNIPNTALLDQHIRALNPKAMLFMDALGEAQRYKTMFPDMIVIYREHGEHGDETVHLRETPEQWLNRRAPMATGGIYQYTTNEPGFDERCINWHIELMELAARRNVPLVIGNWAVGNPGPDDWPKARRMLELLDQHRELFVLGLHEYAGGVITSGLHGGYPDRAGVAPGDTSKPGLNLIPRENWPDSVRDVILWHCGRFNFMVGFCRKAGIRPPRVIITEHGMDDLSDIKPWLQTLKTDQRYHNARGWKSIAPQWAEWWAEWWPGWSPESAYFEQLRWANRVIYQNSVVEAQLIFSWGHSSPMWEQFDVAQATELQRLLEVYALQNETGPVVIKPELRKPDGLRIGLKMRLLTPGSLRSHPSEMAPAVDHIGEGVNITLYEHPCVRDNVSGKGFKWCEVVNGDQAGAAGWLAYEGIRIDMRTTQTAEIPVAKPERPDQHEYEFKMKIRVRADTQETAALMARYLTMVTNNAWRELNYSQRLLGAIQQIADVHIETEIPLDV
ncbi:MAG: hypothetical protein JNJ61_27125 [Anaerolineae bacterium]|nr:hypothetical protein [Anaerolineae bacterium]